MIAPPASTSVIPGCESEIWKEPVPEHETIGQAMPAASRACFVSRSRRECLVDRPLLLGAVGDPDQVALPGHQPGEVDPLERGCFTGERSRRVARLDASAGEADIDFDHDPHRATGGGECGCERPQLIRVIDGDDRVGTATQLDETCDLAGPDDRVGDQEIAHARVCHQLGLAQLGAREADGPGRDLTRTDAPAAMALDVGAPGDSGRSARLENEADVVVHHVEVDAQGRSVQIVLRAAERRHVPRTRHESVLSRSGADGDQDAKPGLPGTRPSENARRPS